MDVFRASGTSTDLIFEDLESLLRWLFTLYEDQKMSMIIRGRSVKDEPFRVNLRRRDGTEHLMSHIEKGHLNTDNFEVWWESSNVAIQHYLKVTKYTLVTLETVEVACPDAFGN